MREIKFRGKRVDNGEWVYGYLIGKDVIVGDIVEFCEEYFNCEYWWRVDPKTVGQYTGLKDRNGKEIYEGDILRTKRMKFNDSGYCIEMVEVHGKVVYRECMFRLELTNGSMSELWFGSNYHEVIDDGRYNHELLKGEETA